MKLFKKSRIGAIMILLLSNCTQICRKEFANADYLYLYIYIYIYIYILVKSCVYLLVNALSEPIIGIYLHEFIN